jgi:Mn-containing catalase
MLETTKKQAADAKVEAEHALRALKEDFELAKLTLSEKSRNLENQLQSVNQAYHVGDSVQKDREQIVRDYQKDGEFNSGAVRATILQNQQLNN